MISGVLVGDIEITYGFSAPDMNGTKNIYLNHHKKHDMVSIKNTDKEFQEILEDFFNKVKSRNKERSK